MEPPPERKNEVAKAERIRNGNSFYAILLCLSLICAVACSNEKTPQEKSAEPDESCLSTDVSSTSEGLVITNTGKRSWGKFAAKLEEGPDEDIDPASDNSFHYSNSFRYNSESEYKVMPPAWRRWAEGGTRSQSNGESENKGVPLPTTVTIPWNKFVRDDGLRFDPEKYAFKGISVTAFTSGDAFDLLGVFSTTSKMDRDDRGVYLNRCKHHL